MFPVNVSLGSDVSSLTHELLGYSLTLQFVLGR